VRGRNELPLGEPSRGGSFTRTGGGRGCALARRSEARSSETDSTESVHRNSYYLLNEPPEAHGSSKPTRARSRGPTASRRPLTAEPIATALERRRVGSPRSRRSPPSQSPGNRRASSAVARTTPFRRGNSAQRGRAREGRKIERDRCGLLYESVRNRTDRRLNRVLLLEFNSVTWLKWTLRTSAAAGARKNPLSTGSEPPRSGNLERVTCSLSKGTGLSATRRTACVLRSRCSRSPHCRGIAAATTLPESLPPRRSAAVWPGFPARAAPEARWGVRPQRRVRVACPS
jgi:hypothetical protein